MRRSCSTNWPGASTTFSISSEMTTALVSGGYAGSFSTAACFNQAGTEVDAAARQVQRIGMSATRGFLVDLGTLGSPEHGLFVVDRLYFVKEGFELFVFCYRNCHIRHCEIAFGDDLLPLLGALRVADGVG